VRFLGFSGMPEEVSRWVTDLNMPPLAILLAIYLMYFILGTVLEGIGMFLLTLPVVFPVILSLGYDPIWFGIIVIVLGEVGLVTPPVGLNVFVVARVTNQPVGEVFRGVTPHVFAHLVALALLTIFPELVLWLPNTMK
jgi:C4-dicarboxylate transporter DctM subunit